MILRVLQGKEERKGVVAEEGDRIIREVLFVFRIGKITAFLYTGEKNREGNIDETRESECLRNPLWHKKIGTQSTHIVTGKK